MKIDVHHYLLDQIFESAHYEGPLCSVIHHRQVEVDSVRLAISLVFSLALPASH